jgi:hypothetical protein
VNWENSLWIEDFKVVSAFNNPRYSSLLVLMQLLLERALS